MQVISVGLACSASLLVGVGFGGFIFGQLMGVINMAHGGISLPWAPYINLVGLGAGATQDLALDGTHLFSSP